MMDATLRAQLVEVMQIGNESSETQNSLIAQVQRVAASRLTMTMLQLLTDEQLETVGAMQMQGATDEQLTEWLALNVPNYAEIVWTTVLDVAREAAMEE